MDSTNSLPPYGAVLFGVVNHFALKEFGDIEEDCEGEDEQEVAEEVVPVAGRVNLAPVGGGGGRVAKSLFFLKVGFLSKINLFKAYICTFCKLQQKV